MSNTKYIKWIASKISDTKHSWLNYSKLLQKLNNIVFTYTIETDSNRAADGIAIRGKWLMTNNISPAEELEIFKEKPCTVLEMIFALANRIERDIMQNETMGNRTAKWFWIMIRNVGLSMQTNDSFDEEFVEERIKILLERSYLPNGKGGLFMMSNRGDLRVVEFWYQAMWYLDEIIKEEDLNV